MRYTIPQLINGREKSCGAVIWRPCAGGHEFLMIRHGNHWSFPKGHMEGKESEIQTALREIKEETNLDVALDSRFREVVTYRTKLGHFKDVVFFIAQPIYGRERPQVEEIQALGWFTYDEALPLVTFATDNDVLNAAERYINAK
ncbi:MAG TPA: NUDIX domain-containing protein [Methanocorpusculum sp.]|nr:NUDIX domain-containing protein [Methanocorpusculum sp.]